MDLTHPLLVCCFRRLWFCIMYGLLGFLAMSMIILLGTQSASLGDSVMGINFFKLAKWRMDTYGVPQSPQRLQHRLATTTPSVTPKPTMLKTVTVQRYTYVELKCPVEGSPVVWTVISGQPDGIHARDMLIFPSVTGEVDQQYQCRVSDETATLYVHIIDDDIHHGTDAVSDICEHGKVCPISCGAPAEWDGVALVKEHWTPLEWPTSKQVRCACYSQAICVVSYALRVCSSLLFLYVFDRLTRASSATDSCSLICSLHLPVWRATTCIPSQLRALSNLVSPSTLN